MLKTPQERLRLARGVGDGLPNEARDVSALASALEHFGRHLPDKERPGERPAGRRSGFDQRLDAAVRAFQRSFGLKADGRVLPQGPTQKTLNVLLAGGLGELVPDGTAVRTKRDFEARLKLRGSVGERADNRREDREMVRLGLGASGFLQPGAALDEALDDARLSAGIERMNRRFGFSGDSQIAPGSRGEALLVSILKRTYGGSLPEERRDTGLGRQAAGSGADPRRVQLSELSPDRAPPAPPPFRSKGKETRQPYDPIAGAVERAELPDRLEAATGAPVPAYVNQTPGVLYNWMEWHRAAKLAGAGKNELFTLMEIFGVEGGLQREFGGGSAIAGILRHTVRTYGPDAGVPASTDPKDLNNSQRIAIYREYFKRKNGGLGHIDGINGLEKMGHQHVAAAVADTVWRNGGRAVGFVLQEGLNEVLAAYPEIAERVFEELTASRSSSRWTAQFQTDPRGYRLFVDSAFGDASLVTARLVAEVPEARALLLRQIAERRYRWDRDKDERKGVEKGDIHRYTHFAFLGPDEQLSFNVE